MAPRNRPRRTVSEPPDLSTLGLSAERKQTPQVGEKPGNRMRLKEGSLGGGLFPFLAHTHRAGIVAATADSGLVRAIRGQSSAERDQDPA